MRTIKLHTSYEALKTLVLGFLVIYCFAITIILFRQPREKVIMVSESGSYVLDEKTPEESLTSEKLNFIRDFIKKFYRYTERNFEMDVYLGGREMLTDAAFNSQKTEMERIVQKMKQEKMSVDFHILDLRQIDEKHFEVDLNLQTVLQAQNPNITKIRVKLEVHSKDRSLVTGYPFEIASIAEEQI